MFVELEPGLEGLLHISEISDQKIEKPEEALKVGQEVEVKILKIDREKQKLSLGLKQLTASPWDTIEDRFSRGMTVPGKVTRVMEFGAFVELEPGIEGLVHVSELAPSRVRRVSDIVKPDQEVEVRILKIEPGAFSTVPFVHEYWEEVFLVSGDLVCGSDAQGKGGESFTGPTYCVRPPGVYHGPFTSKNGCLLLETHYYVPK